MRRSWRLSSDRNHWRTDRSIRHRGPRAPCLRPRRIRRTSSSSACASLLIVADAFTQKLFLDRFGDPAIAGHIAGPPAARIVGRLKHFGREPKVKAIRRTRRCDFDSVIHSYHYGAILAQSNRSGVQSVIGEDAQTGRRCDREPRLTKRKLNRSLGMPLTGNAGYVSYSSESKCPGSFQLLTAESRCPTFREILIFIRLILRVKVVV